MQCEASLWRGVCRTLDMCSCERFVRNKLEVTGPSLTRTFLENGARLSLAEVGVSAARFLAVPVAWRAQRAGRGRARAATGELQRVASVICARRIRRTRLVWQHQGSAERKCSGIGCSTACSIRRAGQNSIRWTLVWVWVWQKQGSKESSLYCCSIACSIRRAGQNTIRWTHLPQQQHRVQRALAQAVIDLWHSCRRGA
jgi:hypothetical protein